MAPDQRGEVGDIVVADTDSVQPDLADGFLHVDGVPVDDSIEGEAKGAAPAEPSVPIEKLLDKDRSEHLRRMIQRRVHHRGAGLTAEGRPRRQDESRSRIA